MTPDPNQTVPMITEAAQPKLARRAVPIWLMVLLFLLLYWGMVYFDERSGWANPQVYAPYHSLEEVQAYNLLLAPGNAHYDRGRVVFESNCSLCHNSDGAGKPAQAPPFIGSDWVLGTPNRLIRIPQNGLSGPITVKGAVWNQAPSMAPMGAPLTDDDLAAVLTYIRQSWGNKASDVTPEQVKTVRTEVSNRTQPWTEAELNSVQ